MKQRVRRWKAMMMAVMLVLSIILPAKTVRAADLATTIQVTGIEEGCNVYAYAVAIDAVDAKMEIITGNTIRREMLSRE